MFCRVLLLAKVLEPDQITDAVRSPLPHCVTESLPAHLVVSLPCNSCLPPGVLGGLPGLASWESYYYTQVLIEKCADTHRGFTSSTGVPEGDPLSVLNFKWRFTGIPENADIQTVAAWREQIGWKAKVLKRLRNAVWLVCGETERLDLVSSFNDLPVLIEPLVDVSKKPHVIVADA